MSINIEKDPIEQAKRVQFAQISLYFNLPREVQDSLLVFSQEIPFSFQQRKILCDMSADLLMWKESMVWDFIGSERLLEVKDKRKKSLTNAIFTEIEKKYFLLRDGVKNYSDFRGEEVALIPPSTEFIAPEGKILGRCPVSSEKTRCCQLMTLDVVWQCGFDCSYCSIQSFYYGNKVRFVKNLAQRLSEIEIDPSLRYHIGTGQSSDSLMWGNRHGLLENLTQFATQHPNIILEMKSKSDNISWFQQQYKENGTPPPRNILFTWSLNTPHLIRVEERGSATLERRLQAARALADMGCAVGFHFHPMVMYDNWKEDYRNLVKQVVELFNPSEIMTLSIGTLTYIKPVIKKVRARLTKSRILQMPMEEIAGKVSYPYEQKVEMFSWLYQSFPESWREQLFYYMCMEDSALWLDVFGFEYTNNDQFEKSMLDRYFDFLEGRK